jgi:hypothetical protein
MIGTLLWFIESPYGFGTGAKVIIKLPMTTEHNANSTGIPGFKFITISFGALCGNSGINHYPQKIWIHTLIQIIV